MVIQLAKGVIGLANISAGAWKSLYKSKAWQVIGKGLIHLRQGRLAWKTGWHDKNEQSAQIEQIERE